MTTAALIDDHVLFRDVLKVLFEQRGGPQVVAETSGSEDVVRLVSAVRPDVVLLDIMFPSGPDGIDVARELLASDSSQRIIFVTMMKDAKRIAEAIRAGVLGYVTKDQSAAELLQAVNEVVAGRPYVAPRGVAMGKARSQESEGLASLTRREREVFDLIVGGATSRVAAERLAISLRTVETHRTRIMAKFGVHSAGDLIRLAARLGLIE